MYLKSLKILFAITLVALIYTTFVLTKSKNEIQELKNDINELDNVLNITNEEKAELEMSLEDKLKKNKKLSDKNKKLKKKKEELSSKNKELESNLENVEQKLKEAKETKEAKQVSKSDTSVSKGNGYKDWKPISVEATAYTAYCDGCTGTTATGIDIRSNPNKKVVAVDPSVIPLGSTVYVEGYGEAVAGDTGGAIKGNRIDVFINSKEKMREFGRKNMTVYVKEM